ncbi:hypothetical protein MYCTH_60397 [Thermothelomyces thermophilus ATCC 42464]|uniref:Uncharacterized protein n=1 Tax=Thermothelomyces thermophilus (strain ATCC 42464 / BCRC 31852 / DSM 1799) TaxID=573729 RepID=G2QLW8_THET4|nr:uncharacterized protein MYCTH_60397 [Thermothelomyces thermophilus ATCC 42464]AEO60948.1 hypothetical protein MYCTH_60397 [Thermothelomyces thermophilus ATCC 42464]
MDRQQPSRLLSTSARVHPPYLPYLHNASRTRAKSLKWLPPLAAAVVVTAGYAVSTYRGEIAGQATSSSSSSSTSAEHHTSALSPEQAEAEQLRRREAAMADAYGDRSSLEELERAVAVYEAQRGAR